MSTKTILQLPVAALGLTGSEQIELVQGSGTTATSIRASLAQIIALFASGPTGVASASPTGANNDYTVNGEMGSTIGFIDLTPGATCNLTGLKAGYDGQFVTITNLGTPNLTLNALNSGSQAPNQFRMQSDFSLIQNGSKSFRYSATIGKWIAIEF
jgi:hypothetical protein